MPRAIVAHHPDDASSVRETERDHLQHSVAKDLVGVNAARGIKVIGRSGEGPRKILPPPKETVRAPLAEATPDLRIKIAFASSTGLRASEQHAIRWQHIDLAVGEVTVETTVDAYDEEGPTKTAAGSRTIPISQSLIVALKAWKLRSKFKKSGDLVFPNKAGRYTNHRNLVQRHFEPLFDKVNEKRIAKGGDPAVLQIRFNWHALRHFAISCWIEAALSPETVQTFAGHNSLQVTMDRYGHLFKSEDHKKAMDAIAAEMLR